MTASNRLDPTPFGSADVLATGELARRPPRPPDFAAESRALSALAEELAGESRDLLQRLADIAIELCRCDSAGVSIVESGGPPRPLRWQAVAGRYAPRRGTVLPEDATPCGLVLRRDAILLLEHPGRRFALLDELEPPVVEALHLPFHHRGVPVGTVWVATHTAGREFDAEDARLLTSLARFAAAGHHLSSALDVETAERSDLERRVRLRTLELSRANERLREEVTRRRSREDELRRLRAEAERQLRTFDAALSSTEDLVYLFDPEGRFTYANRAMLELWGVELEGILGHTVAELDCPPDRIERHQEHLASVRATRRPLRLERRWQEPDGEVRVYEDIFAPVLERGGSRVEAVVGVTRDITERKLREMNSRFLDELSAELACAAGPEDVLATAAERIGRHLEVDRVAFAERLGTEERVRVLRMWTREGVAPNQDEPRELRSCLSADGLAELRAGRLLAVGDVATHWATAPRAEAHVARGVRAVLQAPDSGEEGWRFLLAVCRERPCEWTASEAALVRELSARVWLWLERERMVEELRASERHLSILARSLESRVQERTQELEEQARRLRRLAAELTVAEQRERKRLAKILHDGLQQLLFGTMMQLRRTRSLPPRSSELLIDEAIGRLDEAIEAARDLTHRLHPPALHESGLLPTLRWLADDVERRYGLRVDLGSDGPGPSCDEEAALVLLEGVRELLFNTVKHAGVEEVRVRVGCDEDCLEVLVSDEGCGFDVRSLSGGDGAGFGLFSVSERLQALGGSMTVDSAEGEGCRIRLAVPVRPSG